ncbi:MAG: DNA-binding protein [Porphyromonadaceae bacterium]|nr:MAG: DNA-binding protein [Porphyromonadaceae bacterium]
MISLEDLFQLMNKIDRLNQRLEVLDHANMNPEAPFGWLDSPDVMKLLKISSRTLQSYRDNGILPFSKMGGKVFFKRSDVEAILEKNRVDTY